MRHLFLVLLMFYGTAQASQSEEIRADVTGVTVHGSSGAYTFAVTIESDETGCDQYADWWEVLSEEGKLLYRRILVHSHPDTQPFTRSGAHVVVKEDTTIYVRAHMNKLGYVGDVFKGSVAKGLKRSEHTPLFSKDLAQQAPLPNGCAF